MGPWVQDAVDLIQYANGDTNTTWGALRAANGHPAPFNLKYMEIGNENGGTYYNDRYALFYDAIKSNYPAMHIDRLRPGRHPDQPRRWRSRMNIIIPAPATSFPMRPNMTATAATGRRFSWANTPCTSGYGTYGNLSAALGEAAFMTGMERNSDIVSTGLPTRRCLRT